MFRPTLDGRRFLSRDDAYIYCYTPKVLQLENHEGPFALCNLIKSFDNSNIREWVIHFFAIFYSIFYFIVKLISFRLKSDSNVNEPFLELNNNKLEIILN